MIIDVGAVRQDTSFLLADIAGVCLGLNGMGLGWRLRLQALCNTDIARRRVVDEFSLLGGQRIVGVSLVLIDETLRPFMFRILLRDFALLVLGGIWLLALRQIVVLHHGWLRCLRGLLLRSCALLVGLVCVRLVGRAKVVRLADNGFRLL